MNLKTMGIDGGGTNISASIQTFSIPEKSSIYNKLFGFSVLS